MTSTEPAASATNSGDACPPRGASGATSAPAGHSDSNPTAIRTATAAGAEGQLLPGRLEDQHRRQEHAQAHREQRAAQPAGVGQPGPVRQQAEAEDAHLDPLGDRARRIATRHPVEEADPAVNQEPRGGKSAQAPGTPARPPGRSEPGSAACAPRPRRPAPADRHATRGSARAAVLPRARAPSSSAKQTLCAETTRSAAESSSGMSFRESLDRLVYGGAKLLCYGPGNLPHMRRPLSEKRQASLILQPQLTDGDAVPSSRVSSEQPMQAQDDHSSTRSGRRHPRTRAAQPAERDRRAGARDHDARGSPRRGARAPVADGPRGAALAGDDRVAARLQPQPLEGLAADAPRAHRSARDRGSRDRRAARGQPRSRDRARREAARCRSKWIRRAWSRCCRT